MTTTSARADEPVPLGQTAPASEAESAERDPADDGDAFEDWSGDDWSGHEEDPDEGTSCQAYVQALLDEGFGAEGGSERWFATDGSWDDWLAALCVDWPWDDRYAEPPAEGPPAEGPPADEPPADEPPTQEQPTEPAGPSEPAPSEALSAEAGSADALPATTMALATDVLAAPTMSVSGTTVSWTPTAGVSSYVFVRKVPNQTPQYWIVNGTSATPPAVPGQTVNYGVRTNVSGSAWAREVSVTYPASATSTLTAPRMSVSGNTVSWTANPGVSSYVFVRKVPGQTPQYSIVNGTSVTPPVVSGTTVDYGVRTNVSGSFWATEVSIAYASSGSPTPTPTPTPQPIDGTFRMGVVSGSAHKYEISFLKALGARSARLEFGVGTPASNLASDVDAYARAGIRPLLLAGFRGRLPTAAEAQNLGSWAAAYGPGGTFWQGKTYPADTAVTQIEFGNETSYSYQFSDNSLSTYASRAQTYALRARDAANAVRAANPRVGLLAQGDNAVNGTAWVTNVMRAAPTLDDLIAGWTIHPYGPNWATRMDSTINSARSAGARDLPLWVTEWGLSSDNGRCLDDNYGWNRCMTYSSAASTFHSVLSGMHTRYGARLGAFYLYQAHDQYASGTSTGRERYFGALQSNGTAKGAYTTEVKANLAVN